MKHFKYIYLKDNKKAYFLKYIKNANIQNYYILNPKSLLFKIIIRFKFNRELIWGNWKKNIQKYNLVILGENNFNPNFTKYIKKHNPNCRIIMFYWNCIHEGYKRFLKDPNIDEFYTFDKNDAKKYNLKYNSQFYTKDLKIPKRKIINDVVFCGRAKGRENTLNNLQKIFNEHNLKSKFIVTIKEKDFYPYDNYLNDISESKAVLDIFAGEQVGLSLRPMESIFFEKKLITNNLDIVNYDFYEPQNIFIIGKDNFDDIKSFLDSPYKKINQKIIDYYDYHNWLKRFQK